MQYLYKYNAHIGTLTITSDGEHIIGLWLNDIDLKESTEIKEVGPTEIAVFKEAKSWLDLYFDGKVPGFMPPILTNGTAFRQSVWKILCEIPYGEVITYGDIAKKIALQLGKQRMSAQAVGGAVGSNPISILIPCHRVVGASGNLTGYVGGLDKKARLLELEGLDMNRFFIPNSPKR
ncbi:methylated-DNA--[protein]-cysteine S-methyltransferase [Desulfuribacillus alkaliarsenatis]|uniref:methylated-DNA--[protein]-cysteine S-methyltransferase n=1 Tax=Desulfuribacillus alkaliarsenatis TaxID=766136 RepID=UPI003F53CE3E